MFERSTLDIAEKRLERGAGRTMEALQGKKTGVRTRNATLGGGSVFLKCMNHARTAFDDPKVGGLGKTKSRRRKLLILPVSKGINV